ncbi:MAG: 3-deoxy-D-manno-octulosonic acid transferase [Lewinellaceae bacterium]|nr:3-deoxy-D-manno-octulosonic acid transferase [Lewinellaceae bacterium]
MWGFRVLYNTFIYVYCFSIHLVSQWNTKARLWVKGRQNWKQRYPQTFQKKSRVLWLHAASLGEFEQGRPVLESFRQQHPDWQIVLSFFSPSGYELRKNYPMVDFVAYLPADTPGNAHAWMDLIQPDIAIFVKYEFWANYLQALKAQQTPTLLISALFRDQQPFFQWYGAFWRNMLGCFTHFFLQDQHSASLLHSIGFQNLSVVGDTRVDRVSAIAANVPENEKAALFAQDAPVFIAGSSWEADEAVFLPVLLQDQWSHYKIILAPHEIGEKRIAQIELSVEDLPPETRKLTVRYSHAELNDFQAARILIIDNVGMLNTLYRYGHLAWIGGGFGKGIHNTLEPAAFGLPILFGPNYQKFEEARQMVSDGAAFVIKDKQALEASLTLLEKDLVRQQAALAAHLFIQRSQGATQKILHMMEPYL